MIKGQHDIVIIGGGLFGLYSASLLLEKGYNVGLVEMEQDYFKRASGINQARLHSGLHYPRSFDTAQKLIGNFERFATEFDAALHRSFDNYYCIPNEGSKTTVENFEQLGKRFGNLVVESNIPNYLNLDKTSNCFKITEYSLNLNELKNILLSRIESYSDRFTSYLGTDVKTIRKVGDEFRLELAEEELIASQVVNTTYSSVNLILNNLNDMLYRVKYELCELAVVITEKFKNVGVTYVDGPFFSLFPLGDSGVSTLSSVKYTPIHTSDTSVPEFPCQKFRSDCSSNSLQNCNTCSYRPDSQWLKMSDQASEYLNDWDGRYENSLFAVKIKLQHADEDDARPTLITSSLQNKGLHTILSGKISDIYEVKEFIDRSF